MNLLNLFKRNTNIQVSEKVEVTIDSIQRKLANYRPRNRLAVFEGPQIAILDNGFEFKKVDIDNEASSFQHIPFTC
ncbi:MAG: hypothetical protein JKY24_05205 [Pseudomonadales bacterium]|nr:hypothetical protein [Pseudomonadales bacterium]